MQFLRWKLLVFVLAVTLPTGVWASEEKGDDLLDLFGDVESTPPPPPAAAGDDPRLDEWRESMHTIEIAVSGVRNANGRLHILVYDEADAFRRSEVSAAAGYAGPAAARGSMTVEFKVLGAGPYAVFAYHDENDDEVFNLKAGRPLEGYGYSGAVDPWLPPTFERAAIITDSGAVRLNYLETRMRR